MIFDHLPGRGRPEDQAEGLRQLRRVDGPHGPSVRVLNWPRVVMISECPGSDVGARFAFHLACALGREASHLDGSHRRQVVDVSSLGTVAQSSTPTAHNLLVDLAPAASRLPEVLADAVPSKAYQPLWSGLAAGKTLAPAELGTRYHLSVAAESGAVPCPIDQLPRVYEQLVRAISRHSADYRWIVMLGLDGIVPLDRACWQAADDIVLVDNHELSGCQRQVAAMRSRIDDSDPQRTIWTLPKRARWTDRFSPAWLSARRLEPASTRWLEAGIACKTLPNVGWPERCQALALREGSRVDSSLRRSAMRVAQALRLAAACQESDEMLKFEGTQKKIQLDMHTRPITGVTDEFRA